MKYLLVIFSIFVSLHSMAGEKGNGGDPDAVKVVYMGQQLALWLESGNSKKVDLDARAIRIVVDELLASLESKEVDKGVIFLSKKAFVDRFGDEKPARYIVEENSIYFNRSIWRGFAKEEKYILSFQEVLGLAGVEDRYTKAATLVNYLQEIALQNFSYRSLDSSLYAWRTLFRNAKPFDLSLIPKGRTVYLAEFASTAQSTNLLLSFDYRGPLPALEAQFVSSRDVPSNTKREILIKGLDFCFRSESTDKSFKTITYDCIAKAFIYNVGEELFSLNDNYMSFYRETEDGGMNMTNHRSPLRIQLRSDGSKVILKMDLCYEDRLSCFETHYAVLDLEKDKVQE